MSPSQTVQHTDILTFHYTTAYLVEGLQNPVEGLRLLYSDAEQGKRIYLADHSYEGLHHIDTVYTIANIILSSMLQGKVWDLNEFACHVSATNQERLQRYGTNAAVLVVEATHQEEAVNTGQIGQWRACDFFLALPNEFRGKVRKLHKSFVGRAQAFLSFKIPSVTGLVPIGDCVVADHPSGKPLYVMTFSGSADLTVLKPIPADSFEGFAESFTDPDDSLNFNTVIKLSANSILNRKDNLRAFLFAFTALDSFLRDFFKRHKQALLLHRKAGLSPAVQKYAEGIEERREQQGRTEDDHPIAYKFALSASYLGFQNLDQTVVEFGELTRTHRVALTHGLDFDEAALPTVRVRELLAELLRLQAALKKPS
jgi:hypothetical protein